MSATEQAEEAQDEATPRGHSLLAIRLKRLLAAPLALLARLKERRKAAEEEPEESPPPREEARRRRSTLAAEEEEEEVATPAPSRWRRPLVYLAVLLAGGAAGAGLAYSEFARLVSHQSAEIRRQQAELATQAKSLAEARKKLGEEKALRIEAENRLGLILADPVEGRSRLAAAEAAAARGGKGNPEKGGDCTLRPGSIGTTLKGCIEAFNRQ